MGWPTADDSSEALRDPATAFADEAARAFRFPDVDDLGRPIPIVGRFAAVYRARSGDQTCAVRVLLGPPGDRPERLAAVYRHFRDRRPAEFARLGALGDGLRLADGRMAPLITMEWVPGLTLGEWVATRCRAGDRDALNRSAGRWIDLLRALDEAEVAHGDLSPSNVLVDESEALRLVDPDVVCVPELVGRPAPELDLVGNPYQHPGRRPVTPLDPRLDTFAGLALLVALKALAADLGLWSRYGRPRPGAALIVAPEDLVDTASSPLFDELFRADDPEVRRLAEVVSHLYEFDLVEIPALRELIDLGARAPDPDAPTLPDEAHDSPPADLGGLAPGASRRSLEPVDGGRYYEVRWTWPPGATACILTVCDQAPPPGARVDPDAVPARRRWVVPREGFVSPFLLHPRDDWAGGAVVVWAEAEIAGAKQTVGPLVLGHLEGGRTWRRAVGRALGRWFPRGAGGGA